MNIISKLKNIYNNMKYRDIIIMMDGGFCSTMMQYTVGLCFKKIFGSKVSVKFDLSFFDKDGKDCDGNKSRLFQLTKIFPNLDFQAATQEEIALYKDRFYFYNDFPYQFCEELFKKRRPLYVDGYYTHYRYLSLVKDELYRVFSFSHIQLEEQNTAMKAAIEKEPASVAVHVRRGDYINLGWNILTPAYYLSAMQKITSLLSKETPPHFFFFSDDIEYVQKKILSQLPDEVSYTIVDINVNDTGYLDLYLIQLCKHQIASNSSFGYWGGFLNRNKEKIIILPDEWTSNKTPSAAGSQKAHVSPETIQIPCQGLAEYVKYGH